MHVWYASAPLPALAALGNMCVTVKVNVKARALKGAVARKVTPLARGRRGPRVISSRLPVKFGHELESRRRKEAAADFQIVGRALLCTPGPWRLLQGWDIYNPP